jgi:hypothetical protein
MQRERIEQLLQEIKSLNASMGKIADPCYKCLWTDPTPECPDSDWHKYDSINRKIEEILDLLYRE